jgi:hypothetical protein
MMSTYCNANVAGMELSAYNSRLLMPQHWHRQRHTHNDTRLSVPFRRESGPNGYVLLTPQTHSQKLAVGEGPAHF